MKMGRYVRNSPLYIPASIYCILAMPEQHCFSPMQPGKSQASCPTRLMMGLRLTEQQRLYQCKPKESADQIGKQEHWLLQKTTFWGDLFCCLSLIYRKINSLCLVILLVAVGGQWQQIDIVTCQKALGVVLLLLYSLSFIKTCSLVFAVQQNPLLVEARGQNPTHDDGDWNSV